jgi:hypothetical protein
VLNERPSFVTGPISLRQQRRADFDDAVAQSSIHAVAIRNLNFEAPDPKLTQTISYPAAVQDRSSTVDHREPQIFRMICRARRETATATATGFQSPTEEQPIQRRYAATT